MSKLKITAAAVFACAIGSQSNVAWSAASNSDRDLQLMVERIVNQRTQALQDRINELEVQVSTLKKQKVREKVVVVHEQRDVPPNKRTARRETSSPKRLVGPNASERAKEQKLFQTDDPERSHAQFVRTILDLGGTPVFSSPYIGINSEYDGTDLIVLAPVVNFDTRLLKQERALEQVIAEQGVSFPSHPIIDVSGKIEAQALTTSSTNHDNNRADIELASAEFDVAAMVNRWVTGFMALSFDNSQTTPIGTSNSRFYLKQGFITIGNLNVSPFYATGGQYYLPFGQYSSYMLSAPTTQLLGRIKERALTLGATQDKGLYGSVFIFKGATTGDGSRAGGGGIGYKAKHGKFTADVSVEAVSNLAESEGMQFTAAPSFIPFSGFGESSQAEDLRRAVPAIDLMGNFSYGSFTLLTEYISATTSFNRHDLSYNFRGAKPSAFHIEGDYAFKVMGNKPANIAIGYDNTRESLALLFPKDRFLAAFNISFFRNTIATVEYRHDSNYGSCDVASGANSDYFRSPYGAVDMVTFQFGIYF